MVAEKSVSPVIEQCAGKLQFYFSSHLGKMGSSGSSESPFGCLVDWANYKQRGHSLVAFAWSLIVGNLVGTI